MTFERRTTSNDAIFEGKGLHSGEPVVVIVRPKEDGILFRCGSEQVRAVPENVTDTTRCTRLGAISTIEHLMSALAALEITGADIEVSANELPALDGASANFVAGLIAAEIVSCGTIVVDGPFARVYEKHSDSEIAISKGEGHWRYVFEGGDRWPPYQDYEVFINPKVYEKEIAPARTFGFHDEIEQIRAAGLAQGLDEKTALVLGAEGYVNEAKFPDEPVRHKMLDLIGDLYLSGVPIRALNVSAHKSGHTANVLAAAKLAAAVKLSFS